MTENRSFCRILHYKYLASKHPSILQDTPEFIRHIQTLSEAEPFPENAILDVSLYLNLSSVKKYLSGIKIIFKNCGQI